ncbi:MAG TPA: glycosyltransferase family 87 protein, partial [Candidatus Kryptonia bacterium]|nr:glycosyltransferase family 87 protein [Candidatus Kryptonia bacterium]
VWPMVWLPTDVALRLWGLGNFALVLCAAALAVSELAPARTARLPVFVCLATLFTYYFPCQLELQAGQVDIILLVLLLLTYRLYRRRSRAAGLPLAFALAVKPLLAPMLAFFAWKREWKIVFSTAATTVLLTVASFAVAGWHQVPRYLNAHRVWATGPLLAFPVNQSATALALRAFTVNGYSEPVTVQPWLATALPLFVGLAAALVWLTVMSRRDNRDEPVNGIEFGLTLTTGMLISPLTEDIHFVWVLTPLAALLLIAMRDAEAGAWWRLAVVVALALYFGHPGTQATAYTGWVAVANAGELVKRADVIYTGVFLYGLIVLDAWLALYCMRRWATGTYASSR